MSIARDDLDAGRVDLRAFVEPGSVPLGPVHPGEILLEEFMRPVGISARALARALSVPPNRITAIVKGERAVTAETALRLARCFGGSAGWWLRLQAAHDEAVAKAVWGPRVEAEVVSLGR
jgi:addiction module HigA family antidote